MFGWAFTLLLIVFVAGLLGLSGWPGIVASMAWAFFVAIVAVPSAFYINSRAPET